MAATADEDIVRDLHELNMNTVPAYRESHTTHFKQHHDVVREMLFYDDSMIFVAAPKGYSRFPNLAEQVNCHIGTAEQEAKVEKHGGKLGSKEMGTEQTIAGTVGFDGGQDKGVEGTEARDGVGRAPDSRVWRTATFFDGTPTGCRGTIQLY